MSLPETIWWCKTHGQRGRYSDKCIMVSYLEVQGASVADLCHMVEVELHPVGSRVAGRDDLLIRREGMVERALAAYRNPHTQRIKRRAATPEDRMEAALLAAAEGEET